MLYDEAKKLMTNKEFIDGLQEDVNMAVDSIGKLIDADKDQTFIKWANDQLAYKEMLDNYVKTDHPDIAAVWDETENKYVAEVEKLKLAADGRTAAIIEKSGENGEGRATMTSVSAVMVALALFTQY